MKRKITGPGKKTRPVIFELYDNRKFAERLFVVLAIIPSKYRQGGINQV